MSSIARSRAAAQQQLDARRSTRRGRARVRWTPSALVEAALERRGRCRRATALGAKSSSSVGVLVGPAVAVALRRRSRGGEARARQQEERRREAAAIGRAGQARPRL